MCDREPTVCCAMAPPERARGLIMIKAWLVAWSATICPPLLALKSEREAKIAPFGFAELGCSEKGWKKYRSYQIVDNNNQYPDNDETHAYLDTPPIQFRGAFGNSNIF